ncbi:uncharacterized protein LOC107262837 [Cephus cinctus]|uniref:Uncharacterized protein LOC107262837 n=1 Tax=Cephus cinctus TaxID=211228 RepID=A0AAJ7R809_CEPCN|nr:uncharacterized protein LOC107262837 [Cephus cinctus]
MIYYKLFSNTRSTLLNMFNNDNDFSTGIIIGRSMRRSMHRMNDCQANNYQRYSFLLHIRRWITELWNNVIKRFKNIFQEARRLEMLRSYTARSASPVLVSTSNRVLNTDSEQEKTFWREGRPSKSEKRSSTLIIYSKARATMNYCTSSTKSKDLDVMQRMTSNCMIHEKFINDQRNINCTKGTESSLSSRLDDEYNALYRKRSSIHDGHLLRELTSEMNIKSNNPNGMRYQENKGDKPQEDLSKWPDKVQQSTESFTSEECNEATPDQAFCRWLHQIWTISNNVTSRLKYLLRVSPSSRTSSSDESLETNGDESSSNELSTLYDAVETEEESIRHHDRSAYGHHSLCGRRIPHGHLCVPGLPCVNDGSEEYRVIEESNLRSPEIKLPGNVFLRNSVPCPVLVLPRIRHENNGPRMYIPEVFQHGVRTDCRYV